LWNRISFKENAQPTEPGDDHAKLLFIIPAQRPRERDSAALDIYNRSLFRFFHSLGSWPPESGILPNPKILFQQQVTDILNPINVPATDGDRVELSPEMLIKHLTLQILTNFVLNSPELRIYQQNEIHLTITVPNVYSLPHAEVIKQFVRRNAPGLSCVEVLSESDAVGYYALKTINQAKDSPGLIAFKRLWTKELDQSKKLCLVTIDVGKGTTDLSCILVQNPPQQPSGFMRLLGRKSADNHAEKRRRHSVQGKTGKSSGGNYLNYIFARYYDTRLAEAVQNYPFPNQQSLQFGFIKQAPESKLRSQLRTLPVLEQLIERLKKSMNENFEIDEKLLSQTEQQTMLEAVVDQLLLSINEDWATSGERVVYEAFRKNVVQAWLLPTAYEDHSEPSPLKRFLNIFKKVLSKKKSPGFAEDFTTSWQSNSQVELLKRLKQYVADNVDELLDSLQGLVRAHQIVSNDKAHIDGATFVVISGQASQFKPLYTAIRRKCKDLGIGDDQILSMRGVEAKETCCKGVVNFWRDNMLVVNERELHGTYGCIDYFSGKFMAFDMKKVNNEGRDSITYDIESTYLIIFTPRSREEVEDRHPELNDGATALLSIFERESQFTINYDPSTLKLTVNNRELATGNFGAVDSSIYEKVWPEILRP
jgi:hypothetical protein